MDRFVALDISPRHFVRPKNSDWRHVRLLRDNLGALSQAWTLEMSVDPGFLARTNFNYLSKAVRGRMARPQAIFEYNFVKFGASRPRADIIFSYGGFPLDANLPPILYQDSPTDWDAQLKYGFTVKQIEDEIVLKKELVQRADHCAVTTPHARKLLVDEYGADPQRTHVLPYFTPYLDGVEAADVTRKHASGPVEILFVGREARRKGLDVLLQAFVSDKMRSVDARLTIVSTFVDGQMELPTDERITVIPGATVDEVQRLMRRAHIFAMPSRIETFGIVYVEAMAAGTVCVAPNREPQIGLMGGGERGGLVECEVDDVADALAKLCADDTLRCDMALRSLAYFDEVYSTPALVRQFEKAFSATLASRR